MSSDNALPLQGTDKIVGRLEEVLRQHKTKYVFQKLIAQDAFQ